MGFVKRASEFVQENRHYLVVLGVEPDRPEAEYGWMIKGGEVLRDGENTFYRVRRFLEKPTGYVTRPPPKRVLVEYDGHRRRLEHPPSRLSRSRPDGLQTLQPDRARCRAEGYGHVSR